MLKYIVDENYYPMEFPEDERNTALSIAEVLANKGREIVIRIVKEEDDNTDMVDVTRCPDCKFYKCKLNESGRLIQWCEEADFDVSGDFYCCLGALNRKEEKS